MRDIHREYKPFRNYLRQFDLVSSLTDLWCYSLHVMEGLPLPAGYAVGRPPLMRPLKEHLYPWDLDVLARELALNASYRGRRSLRNWNDLAAAINHMRRLDDLAYTEGHDGRRDIMFEMHRLVHRQFPWQMNRGVNPMMRAFKVFGANAIEAVAKSELGMTARQFFKLGMAIGGHFQSKVVMSTTQDYEAIGIPASATRNFFDRITCTLEELKRQVAKGQSYDGDWLYRWNPLEAKPLIRFDSRNPDRVICPIPRYLLRRASGGLFYDLVNVPGFDNPFGGSFQDYIGEVLRKTCKYSHFTILAEKPYLVGGEIFHGVDWILSDRTGHLFIETKTKRLTLNAKTLSDTTALERDLVLMAEAIVRHYRNIRDAQNDLTQWVRDSLPLFPLIVTLEDWFMLSPSVNEMLNQHVRRLLAEAGLEARMLDELPYTIASSHEVEIVAQVIAQVGVAPVMEGKTRSEALGWLLLPFITSKFQHEMRQVDYKLFAREFLSIFPEAF